MDRHIATSEPIQGEQIRGPGPHRLARKPDDREVTAECRPLHEMRIWRIASSVGSDDKGDPAALAETAAALAETIGSEPGHASPGLAETVGEETDGATPAVAERVGRYRDQAHARRRRHGRRLRGARSRARSHGRDQAAASDGGVAAAQQRLLREAQAIAQLSHPNVVAVYDVGDADGQVFVAMELVDGETLRDVAAAQPRTRREILERVPRGGARARGGARRRARPSRLQARQRVRRRRRPRARQRLRPRARGRRRGAATSSDAVAARQSAT